MMKLIKKRMMMIIMIMAAVYSYEVKYLNCNLNMLGTEEKCLKWSNPKNWINNVLPQRDDSISIIDCACTVYDLDNIDINHIHKFANLYLINSKLRFWSKNNMEIAGLISKNSTIDIKCNQTLLISSIIAMNETKIHLSNSKIRNTFPMELTDNTLTINGTSCITSISTTDKRSITMNGKLMTSDTCQVLYEASPCPSANPSPSPSSSPSPSQKTDYTISTICIVLVVVLITVIIIQIVIFERANRRRGRYQNPTFSFDANEE